ncbi:sulfotransferase [Ruegeria arenilitoris]|uniref:sulfotransferase n=1 Tax=Ruegeria arenilitoris TaxID=1173585 RepID=UPI00147B0598|nr:sulfotransferase [Ruegeria arenilitoris]
MNVVGVNCFGRGGSAIFFSILASSPHIITSKEWHREVFPTRRIGKAFRVLRYKYGFTAADPFIGATSAKRLEDIYKTEVVKKPTATQFATKVMDFYSVFNPAISAAHPGTRFVLFLREPVGQCESLIRSGNSLNEAIDWYNSVLELFWRQKLENNDIPVFRFEDLLRNPETFAMSVYETLQLSPPPNGQINLRTKRFGSDRNKNEDAATGWTKVAIKNLGDFIDASVNQRARSRIGEEKAAEILSRTRLTAERFGYKIETATE